MAGKGDVTKLDVCEVWITFKLGIAPNQRTASPPIRVESEKKTAVQVLFWGVYDEAMASGLSNDVSSGEGAGSVVVGESRRGSTTL